MGGVNSALYTANDIQESHNNHTANPFIAFAFTKLKFHVSDFVAISILMLYLIEISHIFIKMIIRAQK